MEDKDQLEDIFYSIREIVNNIIKDERLEDYHTKLYMIAQECCYGLSESELECLHQACLDILYDRRN